MRARLALPLILCTGCSNLWTTQPSPARQPYRTDHLLDGDGPGIAEGVLSICGVSQPSIDVETGEIDIWDRSCAWTVLEGVAESNGLGGAFPGAWIFPTDAARGPLDAGPHEGAGELTHVSGRPVGLGCEHSVGFTEHWDDLAFSVAEIAWDERGSDPGLRVSLDLGTPVFDPTTGTVRSRMPLLTVASYSSVSCPTLAARTAQLAASPALFSNGSHEVALMDPTLDLWLLPDPVGPGDAPVDVVIDFDYADTRVSGSAAAGLLSALGHGSTLDLLEGQGLDVDAAVDRWSGVLETHMAVAADELSGAIEAETRTERIFCEQWADAHGYHVDMSSRPTCGPLGLPTRSTKTPGRGR